MQTLANVVYLTFSHVPLFYLPFSHVPIFYLPFLHVPNFYLTLSHIPLFYLTFLHVTPFYLTFSHQICCAKFPDFLRCRNYIASPSYQKPCTDLKILNLKEGSVLTACVIFN